jgi:UPF0271 protein
MLLDLNADVGEGCGDDAALLALVTSASVACGGHAGDAVSMRRVVELAVHHGVAIGAHVSYPDRENFGRRDLRLPAAELTAHVLYQLGALAAIAAAAGARLCYVKPHGALYNRMADDAVTAEAVLTAMQAFDASLPLLTLPGSIAAQCAEKHRIKAVAEAFADRAYQDNGRLLPRAEPGAVLHDTKQVAVRALRWAREGVMDSISGRPVHIAARSLCVHGDTPEAVSMARALRAGLEHAGVQLKAFA